jgi:putative tryptophan/tyrosine transport system substrate-binding protein
LGSISNLKIAMQFGGADYGVSLANYRQKAQDLVNTNPDLILCTCWPTLRTVLDARHVTTPPALPTPIVFAGVIDLTPNPAGNPNYQPSGNNVFGFIDHGTNLCMKWPGLLRQIAGVTRAAVIYDANSDLDGREFSYTAINAAWQALPPGPLGPLPPLSKINVRSLDIQDFANCTGQFATSGPCVPGGLIIPAGVPMTVFRQQIIQQAKLNKLPAVYANRLYAMDGGLISMGTNTPNLYVKAGQYANQILNGTRPAQPIDVSQTGNNAKFETVINLDTAWDLGDLIFTNAKSTASQADVVIDQGGY